MDNSVEASSTRLNESSKRRTGYCGNGREVHKFACRVCAVCLLWICTFLSAPTDVHATWMWLGAASLGTVSVGPGSSPQQRPVTSPPVTNIMVDPGTLCRQVPGLTTEQIRVCESTPDIINIISEGAKVGIIECQRQFSTERWNCSVIGDARNPFGPIISTGNKETAFIYAITSAGVVYSVTRSCSLGNLTECGCTVARGHPGDDVLDNAEEWRWGGCSDNVDYGIALSKKFVDAADRSSSSSSSSRSSSLSTSGPPAAPTNSRKLTRESEKRVMNLHNNEAGRQIMKINMRTQCRCHGVSASCSIKTCWQTMPTFSEVGDIIKEKYRYSVEVIIRKKKKRSQLRHKAKRNRRFPIADDDLVYMQRSPNYCRYDQERGIVGTTARECNRTSMGSDSCDLLCCGRGYNTQEIRRVERCDCKFVWCCKVKCRVCETVQDIYTCK
ncbi:protein Wnt-16-like [Diadema setosum]|uniref:protein Wnt-16-like n=1 Tax=Diadema setosum TaxID=31175 RepID=UPI003B3B921A